MMKKFALFALLGLAIAGAAPVAEAHGWGHGPRFAVGINLGFPGYYYPGYYPAYYPGPYYYAPEVIVQQPVVVQQPASQVVYSYYCPATSAYYPAVPTCAQPWLKVVPNGSVSN